MGTKRTAAMPGSQLRVGDIILEEGRKWRIAKPPVPELLDSGRVRWHVPADAVDAGELPAGYEHVSFVWIDTHDWLVQF